MKHRYRKVVRTEASSLTTPMDVGPSEKSLYMWGKEKVPVIGNELPTVFAADEKDPPDSTGALGQLRVGLQDTEGKPISGFGTDDCELLRTNSTRAEVRRTTS